MERKGDTVTEYQQKGKPCFLFSVTPKSRKKNNAIFPFLISYNKKKGFNSILKQGSCWNLANM